MMITVGGKVGAGKGTCTKLLSEKLGYEIISIGDMKRRIAEQMGISIQAFNELGELPENVEEFDKKYEEFQQLLDPHSDTILDSRLSYWCQPKAFHIFLDVDDTEGARRVLGDERSTDDHGTLEQTIYINRQRNQMDGQRYFSLYGTNPRVLENYDLVIDTTNKTPTQIVEEIYIAYTRWCTQTKI